MEYNWHPIKFSNVARFLCHCVIVSKLHPTPLILEIHSCHNDPRKWRRSSWAIPTPLKALRAWFWLRRLKFSKLVERKGAIRPLVPLDVFKLQEITVDGRIPVVREPKFRTLRLHLTSRSIRVYIVRVHIFVTGTSYLQIDWNQSASPPPASTSKSPNFWENC